MEICTQKPNWVFMINFHTEIVPRKYLVGLILCYRLKLSAFGSNLPVFLDHLTQQQRIARFFFKIFHPTKINILNMFRLKIFFHFLRKESLSTLSSSRGSFDQWEVLIQAVLAIVIQNNQRRRQNKLETVFRDAKIFFWLKLTPNVFNILVIAANDYRNTLYLSETFFEIIENVIQNSRFLFRLSRLTQFWLFLFETRRWTCTHEH